MYKFNVVQKNKMKQKVVEHMGPSSSGNIVYSPSLLGSSSLSPSSSGPSVSGLSASGPSASGPSASGEVICNANNEVLSSSGTCIPNTPIKFFF